MTICDGVTAVTENNWKRVEYETWDEAFRGLVPAVRQQSVRVASYTQVLFLQACQSSFAKVNSQSKEQIRSQYGDLAYKCGLYHQLGKALVPPEYQLWQNDFTDEEAAVYRKYTVDGRALVARLQAGKRKAHEKRRGGAEELPTLNTPWMMIRESCEQHMERYDGSGYPAGRSGTAISPIAQIVGLAKELDRLASETKSEHPFDDAYNVLLSQKDILWSAELLRVLKNAESKCRAVYNKYIHYTMTLPQTIPLVERHQDRPMGLLYRPMVSDKEGTVVAYEATPWFGAIANRPGETESAREVHSMLVRTGMIEDMSFYFLYEVTDTLLRIENCKLENQGILLQMLPGFYLLPSQLQRFQELFADQEIDRSKLMLSLPEQIYLNATKTRKELIARYLRNGINLVLDDYHPDQIDWNELKEMGFRHLRLAPELYVKRETADLMQTLRENGFTLLGKAADSEDTLLWQLACGVTATCGTMTGIPVMDEELIHTRLAAER